MRDLYLLMSRACNPQWERAGAPKRRGAGPHRCVDCGEQDPACGFYTNKHGNPTSRCKICYSAKVVARRKREPVHD